MSTYQIPTETIKLPSQGLVYSLTDPLSNGEIEMKYMTAREEDILTNVNYMKDGTVIDRLLKSLIVSKIDIDNLIVGDKNAIIVAARILGYGKDYEFKYTDTKGKEQIAKIDLTTLKEKNLPVSHSKGQNEFEFKLPNTSNIVKFKLLTHKDEKDINLEIKGLEKIDPSQTYDVSTRMKYIITEINGQRDKSSIRSFVDNALLASDARALRKYMTDISPDIDLKYYPNDTAEGIDIPLLSFFWPDAGV